MTTERPRSGAPGTADVPDLLVMSPPPSRRVFRAAWIMARAYTPNLPVALLALPWALVAVIPAALRRGLYLDRDRTGMVILYRPALLLDTLILLPLIFPAMLAAIAVTVGFAAQLPLWATVGMVLSVIVLAMAGLGAIQPESGGSMVPWGPETPDGERWELAGLAQLPGTRLTAVPLAMRVVREVPPEGAVVVATANTPEQYEQYQRLGFTGGPKRRVHRVVG